MAEGFALDAYLTPRGEVNHRIPGGTMAKGSTDHGSTFAHARKIGSTVPGPGQYETTAQDQKIWTSKGNTFAKLSRDARVRLKQAPAVGQYQMAGAFVLTSPRIPGGTMGKTPKRCFITDDAVRSAKAVPEPGKYDPQLPTETTKTHAFGSSKTSARGSQAKALPGPGTYDPNFNLSEPRIPAYSSSKEAVKSVIENIQKEKAKVPAPGFVGIPDSRFVDRQGAIRHTRILLRER